MTDKEYAVIEAARYVAESHYIYGTAVCGSRLLSQLVDAIQALDAEQENDTEYRGPVMDNNPWITARRPTKDDAWKGCVMIPSTFYMLFEHIGYTDIKDGEPWQPIPTSLRVKPVESKCEECHFFFTHKEDFSGACVLTYKFSPTYGMPGCEFKLR